MTINVQFDSLEEMRFFARGILVEESKEIHEESSPTTADQQAQEDPVNDEATSTYTLEDVRAKLTALTRAGKQKEVRDILDFFKAKNVTALEPKDYAGVMGKAGAV